MTPPVAYGLVLAAFTLLHIVAWKAAEKLGNFLKWHEIEPFFMSIQKPGTVR